MYFIQPFCRFRHRFCLFAIGQVRHVHQAAVVVLAVEAAQDVFIVPGEVGDAHQTRVREAGLNIVAVCLAALRLVAHLIERLSQTLVDGTEVELSDDHRQVRPLEDPVHQFVVGLYVVEVEAHHVEVSGADLGQPFVYGVDVTEAVSQIHVVGVELQLQSFYGGQIAVEGVIDEADATLLRVSVGLQILPQGCLHGAFPSVQERFAQAVLGSHPGGLVAYVITDEPGIYFIPALIDDWRSKGHCKEFINYDLLETYKDFGGIRIEDDLLITKDGCRFLGEKRIPYHTKDVEEYMERNKE